MRRYERVLWSPFIVETDVVSQVPGNESDPRKYNNSSEDDTPSSPSAHIITPISSRPPSFSSLDPLDEQTQRHELAASFEPDNDDDDGENADEQTRLHRRSSNDTIRSNPNSHSLLPVPSPFDEHTSTSSLSRPAPRPVTDGVFFQFICKSRQRGWRKIRWTSSLLWNCCCRRCSTILGNHNYNTWNRQWWSLRGRLPSRKLLCIRLECNDKYVIPIRWFPLNIPPRLFSRSKKWFTSRTRSNPHPIWILSTWYTRRHTRSVVLPDPQDGGDPNGPPMPSDDIPQDSFPKAQWMSYLLMVIGWFILIRSIGEYYRVKQLEKAVRATPTAMGAAPAVVAEGEGETAV